MTTTRLNKIVCSPWLTGCLPLISPKVIPCGPAAAPCWVYVVSPSTVLCLCLVDLLLWWQSSSIAYIASPPSLPPSFPFSPSPCDIIGECLIWFFFCSWQMISYTDFMEISGQVSDKCRYSTCMYRTLMKEGPWAVHLTLGQDWGMGRYSRYQYHVYTRNSTQVSYPCYLHNLNSSSGYYWFQPYSSTITNPEQGWPRVLQ